MAATRQIDKGTLLGLLLAAAGICGGLLLEGGNLWEITQPTAALIVFGGTIGATMIGQPFGVFRAACRQLYRILFEVQSDPHPAIRQIVAFSIKARKGGIVSLEKEVMALTDPFLKKAMTLAIDRSEERRVGKECRL